MSDEIQWKSYIDNDGAPILTAANPPLEVPSTQELKAGEQYLVPTLFGYALGTIEIQSDGSPAAMIGGSIWWLKKAPDTWRSWGGGNLAAIKKLEFPKTLEPLEGGNMDKYGVELDDEKIKKASAEDHVCPKCGRELMKDENLQYQNRCPVHGTEPFEKKP